MKERSTYFHPTFFFFGFLLLLGAGCSLFLGNIKPVEEKSKDYQVLDLKAYDPDWIPFEAKLDRAYRSKQTGATVSLNSSCKNYPSPKKRDLKALTNELLLGITKIISQKQQMIDLHGISALKTTTQGIIEGENI